MNPQALAIVDDVFAFVGRDPQDVGPVVVVGSRGGSLVDALGQRCPHLTRVLVIEPDARIAAQIRAHTNTQAQRIVVPGPADLLAVANFAAAYLMLCQFLLELQQPPSRLTVVSDPKVASVPACSMVLAAARDLCCAFSTEFLRQAAEHPSLQDIVPGFADFIAVAEPYHALKFYWSLPKSRLDQPIILKGFQCTLSLGNDGLVERWIQHSPLDELSRAELRRHVPAALAAAKCSRTELLQRNITFLEAHYPEVAAEVKSSSGGVVYPITIPMVPWVLAPTIKSAVVRCADYALLVRVDSCGLVEQNPVPELRDLHRALTAESDPVPDNVCVASWVRYAATALNLLAIPSNVKRTGWKRIVYLVETDLAVLHALLQTWDLETTVDVRQVHIFAGKTAHRNFARFLEEHINQPMPSLTIGLAKELRDEIVAHRTTLFDESAQLFETLERRYENAPERLLSVLDNSQPRPLRIMLLTSRYTTVLQYVTKDLAAAFEELGHRCRVIVEENAGEELAIASGARELLAFDPDFFLVLDHVRPEYGRLLPPGLPVITWILDELPDLKDPRNIETLGSLDLAYGFSTPVQRIFVDLGYPSVGHLPFAVNPARFWPEAPGESAAVVAYTTHVGQPAQDPPHARGIKAWLEARLGSHSEILLELPRILPELEQGLRELSIEVTAQQKQELLYFGLQIARRLDRLRVAEQIIRAGLPIDVYGLGWDEIPGLKACHQGNIEPGEQLREVYRRHKVVLHINRGCNIHPRVLEAFCCGGFVIARHDPTDDLPGETADQFELGRELFLFRSESEMIALVRRAFNDEGFRRGAIEAAQGRILESHTFKCRAQKILRDLTIAVQRHVERHRRDAPKGQEAPNAHA